MINVNIIIGRFQPFTKGHLRCVEEARKKLHIPTVMVMIDTPESRVDEKHPFPTETLLKPLYEELYVKTGILEDIVIVKNANIVKATEALERFGYHIQSWTCGTDRYMSYKRQVDRYRPDIELIEIHRTDEDISATKVRQALKDGDRDTFAKLMPPVPLRSFIKCDPYILLKDAIDKL